jgi:hypothetical protein
MFVCAQPWITPSLFEQTGNPLIVDEWTFGQYQDPNVARATLSQHWETWITEDDFKAIAGAGCVLTHRKSQYVLNGQYDCTIPDSTMCAFR